ncbi:FecR family protein [Sphingobium yanoikuyae]|uniref:FecR family protein n=1 Tax=Sphingobium yanoikuyae TaxID=13690 RepID=UPI0035AE1C7E
MIEDDQIPSGNQLRKEAALWFARMRGPDAEQHREGFERWLNRGAVHLGAYNRVSEVFNMGKYIEAPDDQRPVHRSRPRLMAAALLTLGIAMGCGVMLLHKAEKGDRTAGQRTAQSQLRSEDQSFARYVTLDQSETVTLSDGSKVRLWPHSALMVSMDRSVRNLRLEQGHGRFDVAHDGRRFIVLAGSGSVTALGTMFDVVIDSAARVSVHLSRGAVEVKMPAIGADGQAQARITRLAPGQSVAFVETSTLIPAQGSVSPHVDKSGQPRSFTAISLDDLVQLANSGTARKIELADPALAQRRISGVFRVDDPQALSQKLARLLDLQSDERDPDKIILRPSTLP